jgi:hypothetical protein
MGSDVDEETFHDHFAATLLFELQLKLFDKRNCCARAQCFNASLNSKSVFLTTVQDGKLSTFVYIA